MRRRLLVPFALVLALVPVALAGCGGDDDEEEAAPPPAEPAPAPAEETTEDATAAGGDAAAGEAVWAEAGCGSCHTLAAAGSSGTIGPNLDDLQPSLEQTVEQVTNGGGGMPAFGDSLSEQQINDVAAYVVESTSG